jgi:hypothetical protein
MNEIIRQRYIKRINKYCEYTDTDDCILWTGATRSGYGRMRFNGSPANVHRITFLLFVGEIPDGLMVLHRCPNRACINHKHLYAGTQFDNMQQMVKDGRHYKLARYEPKLDWDKVDAIRADNRSQDAIALDLGVSRSTVSNVKNNKTWVRPMQLASANHSNIARFMDAQ